MINFMYNTCRNLGAAAIVSQVKVGASGSTGSPGARACIIDSNQRVMLEL